MSLNILINEIIGLFGSGRRIFLLVQIEQAQLSITAGAHRDTETRTRIRLGFCYRGARDSVRRRRNGNLSAFSSCARLRIIGCIDGRRRDRRFCLSLSRKEYV